MGEESAAEKVYEAGLELINPGGDPGKLREAATAWKAIGAALDKMVTDLDRDWRRVKGAGAWTGPSADAFDKHWQELKKAVEDTTPQCDNAAKHLNDAADSIEDINDQIHQIYLEIGVSVGVSVALSFVTVGFSAAAGAARAAQLAARATQLAGRLGQILTRIAQSFRTVAQAMRGQRFIKNVLVNWASNTGATVISKTATGQDVDLAEAAWQGGLSAGVGTGPGLAVTKKVGGLAGNMAGGVAGNVSGGLAVDGVNSARGEGPGLDGAGWNALFNAAGGAAGGAAAHGANTQMPAHRDSPHLSIEGPLNGISYGAANSVNEVVQGNAQYGDDKDSAAGSTGAQHKSAQDKMRDDFG
ncbi:type VII secretion system (Wss) protein ESAT-6 [Streptomyces sp. Amel2xB2]|uniref:Outer membrane channel protein CpnT-like N-terminal domain-containing protein n=1 Tax=Streptomyces nanshensis TaxID=518642 RepID=A0A1E7KY07_9ACTN|nr:MULTISPECIES: WXG100 family type VII secretion target [Streptomyces]OEV08810.1 hypothetical protein AN218_24920 [Streptomyces nanshensis]RAJ66776.1 type VII secretion system (Wss) protein ESAT-6 [Streptomyces sp. Amel2xB2]